jgi:hypothetical protein
MTQQTLSPADKLILRDIPDHLKKGRPLTPDQLEVVARLPADVREQIERHAAAVAEAKKAARRRPMTDAERTAKAARERQTLEPMPPCKDAALVEACRLDLALALKTFWPAAFFRPFSPVHLDIIAGLQDCILNGGHKMAVMWRGGGKTTIGLCSIAWAALYGHRKFQVLIGATQDDANNAVSSIRADLETNPVITDLFPHVSLPFAALDGSPQRCSTQRWHISDGNDRTQLIARTSELRLPIHERNAGSGCIVIGRGMGAIRGLWRLRPDGKRQRPDFVLMDDPQTRESATSEEQTNQREKWILGDVLNLAGHDRKIAAYMPATIIARRDLVCRFLARPDWRGKREPLVVKWPGGQDSFPVSGPEFELWQQYRELRELEMRNEASPGAAAEFYGANRAGLEAGAIIADPELYDHDAEVSAVQHAMLKLWEIGEHAFLSEMQNDPPETMPEADYHLTARDVFNRVNGMDVGRIPDKSDALCACVDLNKDAATWCVVSGNVLPEWGVIDYGKWRPSGMHSLWKRGDKSTIEKAIFCAVESIVAYLREKPYGGGLHAMAIDAGGEWATTVYEAVKQLRRLCHPLKLYAARGLPGDRYELPKTRGILRRRGYLADVRQRAYAGSGVDCILYFDSHYWHMTMQKGWLIPPGCEGAVSVFGQRPTAHVQFAEEIAADRLVRTEIIGERVRAHWDTSGANHYGDTLAMCGALLSTEGIIPDGQKRNKSKRKPVVPIKIAEPEKTEEKVADMTGLVPQQQPAKVRPIRAASWATRW